MTTCSRSISVGFSATWERSSHENPMEVCFAFFPMERIHLTTSPRKCLDSGHLAFTEPRALGCVFLVDMEPLCLDFWHRMQHIDYRSSTSSIHTASVSKPPARRLCLCLFVSVCLSRSPQGQAHRMSIMHSHSRRITSITASPLPC